MTVRVRKVICALLATAGVVGASSDVAQASFGVSLWEAGTCVNHTCTYKSVEDHPAEAFTQAAGHPPWGITTFELEHKKGLLGEEPEGAPLKRVRVDVPQGLASNPQAPPKCSIKVFKEAECPLTTKVGTDEATVVVAGIDTPVVGDVYNLEPDPSEGFQPMPLLFGIKILTEHSFLEGHVAWWSDYHEYFEINNLGGTAPVLKSKLNFEGQAGGNFLTLPSECSSSTTNYLEVESATGEIAKAETHTPVGVEHCDKVPFEPTTEVKPETAQSDQPDGATTEVKVPQKASPGEI